MTTYVFAGHRFTKEYMDDFRGAIESAFREYGDTRIEYADFHLVQGHILKDKIQPLIDGAFFCLFDISDASKPNVFIELGYAYGKGKRVVLTSRTEPPSDLAGYECIVYGSFKELREKLSRYLPQVYMQTIKGRGIKPTELSIPFLDATYRDADPHRETVKSEVYASVSKTEADASIKHLVDQGFLEDLGDCIRYTSKGVEALRPFVRSVRTRFNV